MQSAIQCLVMVDDDPEDLLLLKDALQEGGVVPAKTASVTTLADALKFLKTSPADVVLLDLFLPDSRGIETLDAVRPVTNGVVIVVSGLADETMAAEVIRHGADDFVPKDMLTSRIIRNSLSHSITRRLMLEAKARADDKLRVLDAMTGTA